ncbi:hypothetical protein [Nonomuraea indica]|uniref:hypothetical protein n=1 Tax=Nonomuraea indica TaxID=1581193 RepID=UPI0011844109|nr:hypothetical protein [Nonomuraea indica]
MRDEDRTTFVLLRGRQPVAELVVVADEFPQLYCEVKHLQGFEEVRSTLVRAWEAVEGRAGIWAIVRMKLLRLRLRPSYGGPLISNVVLILDGDRAVLRYRYGPIAMWRLRRWRRNMDADS